MSHPEDTSPAQGIAVIGMSGRFPGAGTLEGFWRNLIDGVESISFYDEEELIAAGNDPALVRHPSYVKARGVIEGVEMFEPAFFGFTPREAELMDPQHRILLECAWEAL
ncbi:MAG TPA: beta-ketoacyl synthase N-terminal-like domain-containing protein, partial [Thermoanaerobaculia bacterium]|nr:beta-ketoacyl synthase N-terminal-like domain-containing protein [Thermoanaerobaculia bacterium]